MDVPFKGTTKYEMMPAKEEMHSMTLQVDTALPMFAIRTLLE